MKAARISLWASAALAIAISGASCALPSITTQRRALVIGISDYINLPPPSPYVASDITYPSVDATDMKNTLESSGWVVDASLLDHAATKAAIQAKISSFFAGLQANDTALIYYSGHGTEISGVSYLVASDYSGDPNDSGQMISPAELATWIAGSMITKNVIFIADSCYSGGFVAARDSSDQINSPYDSASDPTIWVSPLPTIAKFADLLSLNAKASKDLDIVAISASGAQELSWETGVLQNGVFTHFLIEAATKGDKNGDGVVSCTEAYSYAAKRVDSYWNDSEPGSRAFYPHITGGWRDLALF